MNNFLKVINPYKRDGVWAFDDENVGLVREPFVSGADDMLDWFAGELGMEAEGFALFFSDRQFPGYQIRLDWIREEAGGNWYRIEDPPMEGWLCPAMFHYFDTAPKQIFIKAEKSKD